MKDFIVNIVTCERPQSAERILDEVHKFKGDYDITVNVFEDKTETEYDLEIHDYVNWAQTNFQHGKRQYWQLINKVLNDNRQFDSRFYLFIPDDFYLKEDFFTGLEKSWEALPEDKIAILPYMPKSRHRSCWNNFYPVKKQRFDKIDFLDVGYIDMNFMCTTKLLEQIGYEIDEIPKDRWDSDPNLSTGVGRQMTYRINGKCYLHIKGLQYQEEHKSIMNKGADCSYPHL